MQTSPEFMMQKAMNVIDFKQDVVNNVVDPNQHNDMMTMQHNAMQHNTMQQNAMQNAAMQNVAMQNAAMQNMAMQNMALQNTGMIPNQPMMQNQAMVQYPHMMQDPSMFQSSIPDVTTGKKHTEKQTEGGESKYVNSSLSNPYYSSKEFKKASKASNAASVKSIPTEKYSRKDKTSYEAKSLRNTTSPPTHENALSNTFPRIQNTNVRDVINRRMVTDIVSSAMRESEMSTPHRRKNR